MAGGLTPLPNAVCPNSSSQALSDDSVLGGFNNVAGAIWSSVVGGTLNDTTGTESSILGDEGNTTTAVCQAIPAAPINNPANCG